MGRHRRVEQRSTRELLLIGAVIVAVTAGLVAFVGLAGSGSGPGRAAQARSAASRTHSATAQADVLPAVAGASPCTAVHIRTSLENAELVRRLAEAYDGERRNINGHCVQLQVAPDSSGLSSSDVQHEFPSMASGDRPELWIPDSSAWGSLVATRRSAAHQSPLVAERGTSIALSYLVLGMPKPLAETAGWVKNAPTWGQFLATTADPNTWRAVHHPEYGDFKLGKTSPDVASSGLFAFLAEYGASANKLGSLSTSDVSLTPYRQSVTTIERATVHYMSTEEHMLAHCRLADMATSLATWLSAVPVSERGLWEYNKGVISFDGFNYTTLPPPKQPLVPVYPRDGTYVMDNPGYVLDAPWVTAGERAAARDFLRFATTRDGQSVVRQSGYRDLTGRADPKVAEVGHYTDAKIRALPMPTGQLLNAVQASFPAVRKRARVLFLVDVSDSMTTPVAPGVSRMEAAQRAIAAALPYFTDDDEVGLAAFSNVSGQHRILPGLVAPVAPLRNRRVEFLRALLALKPVKATPLYAAVQQFTTEMAATHRPDWINALVLLSDGHNDSSAFPDTLASMTAAVKRATQGRPTMVFTLAYAQQADVPTMRAISSMTFAHFYDATNPARLQRVLGDLVTSF